MKKDEMPSLNRMCTESKKMILFASLFCPKQSNEMKKIHQKACMMKKQIELFCQRFSDYGWCGYDHMDLSMIEHANEKYEKEGLEAAEAVLINFYTTAAKERTNRIIYCDRAFHIREDLLRHYFEDHFAGNYHASIPLGLMIIDGAVNDYTRRKGFFADGTEVDAWDCIVGCNDALAKIKDIFCANRSKTNTDPITMPYRHGILHGRDINYANERVACKGLVLMFAVATWMGMKNSEEKRKANFEKKVNPPSLIESIQNIQRVREDGEMLKQWKSREILIGTDIPETGEAAEFSSYPPVLAIVEMLEAWKRKNYGDLGEKLSMMLPNHSTQGRRAGACRALFDSKLFQSFRFLSVKEESYDRVGVEVYLEWIYGGDVRTGIVKLASVYENEGNIAYPWRNNGEWKLYPRDVCALNL